MQTFFIDFEVFHFESWILEDIKLRKKKEIRFEVDRI
jgi:hypothetical protein